LTLDIIGNPLTDFDDDTFCTQFEKKPPCSPSDKYEVSAEISLVQNLRQKH
jgi:hypothetical protein